MTRTLFTILISAAATIAQVQSLLEQGANSDARDANANTALHFAASFGYTEIAQLLVDAGADAHAINDFNATPIKSAMGWGHRDIVEILRSTDEPTQSNVTFSAAFAGFVDAVFGVDLASA